MARGELISILGLYNADETLFEEMIFPDVIDADYLIDNIILETAELEVVYPQPKIMKGAIGFWSKSRLKAWNDIKNVLYVENYKPFINISRIESGFDEQARDLASSSTATGNELNKVSAFNSSSLENKDSSENESQVDSTDTGTIRTEFEHVIEGLGGTYSIKTKQEIIEREIELRLKYDLCRIIVDEFKSKFCLLIY